jgi:hypothetical protein
MVIAPLSASAATPKSSTPTINNSTNTLKISPLRTDLTIAAGTTGKVTVTVYNTTNSPVLLRAIENDFVAGDEGGKPSVILDQNSYAPTHSLKRFMVALPNVTIPANNTADVTVTITVPKTAQAGGYFGALRFAPAIDSTGKQVNLGASVVSLILLTVPGPTVERLTMTNFDIQQNGGTASNFRTPDNLALFLRFENKGNLQEAPYGQIYVKKGNKVTFKQDFNNIDPKDQILPDSARRWNIPIKGLSKFGKYTVGATFGYGSQGQNIEITKTVWIVQTVYIAIIGGAILLLALIISGFWLFIRSYKRRILRSSRRRY